MTNVQETLIPGVFKLISEPFEDNRGSFLNLFRENEESFRNTWGSRNFKQINLSNTKNLGAIRGLHLQKKPYQEAKIVRCIKGKIFDVIVDLREESKTFGKSYSLILDSKKMNMIFVPSGFAHGFQTLLPDCEMLYLHTDYHNTELEKGYHYNSSDLKIPWPLEVTQISEKDKNLEIFKCERKKVFHEV